MKYYLAQEDQERFYFLAKDMEDAKEKATIWNAVILCESKFIEGDELINPYEYKF
jgi:hypothetical protein